MNLGYKVMTDRKSKIKNLICLVFLIGISLFALSNSAEACTRKAPSILFSPTSGVLGASSSKEYKVTITNNDVEEGPACGTSTFTLAVNSQTLIPLVNTSFNTGSTSVGTDCNAVALSPGQRCNTTLTVTTLTITDDDKLRVVVQATEAAHATGKGSVVTKASSFKGEGNILKRAKEETCHACHKTDRNRTPSDADWADAIKSHSSISLSSGKWSASGGWGVAGGKYGEFVCTTCHTSHDTTNIYLIKETITTPDGSNFVGSGTSSVTVDFRVKGSGIGSMGDDTSAHGNSSKICEVCHTYDAGQTTGVNKHAYNSPAGTHENASDCTSCHSHRSAFSGAGGTCNSCHGAPVGSGSDNNAPAQYKASHEKHYDPAAGVPTSYTDTSNASTTTAYVFRCGRCHSDNSANHTANTDGTVDVLLPLGGTFTPGSYTGGDNPPPPGTVTFKNSNGTCSNVYCHSTGASNNSPYPAPNITPTWGGSLDATCTGCHNGYSGATSKMSTGTHTAHINNASIIGSNYSCQICHSATASGNTAIWQYSSHTNKEVNVAFTALNPSGAYNGTAIPGDPYDTCSTIYCHSNGKVDGTAGAYLTPAWDGAAIGCNGCHGVGTTAGTPNYANGGAGSDGANSHQKHTKSGTGTCVYCHTNTTTTGTTITGTVHIDNTRNVLEGGGKNFSYTQASQTCSSISCHYSGNAQWGAALACNACHGLPPATGAHLTHTDGTGAAYGNDSNSSIAAAYRFNCGNCHPLNSTSHANGTTDIELYNASAAGFKANNPSGASVKSGSALTTICQSVYCHSNGASGGDRAYKDTPQWGGAFGANKCGSCHDNPPQYAGQSHYVASNFMGKEGGHLVGIHSDNISNGVAGSGLLTAGTGDNNSHGSSTYSTTLSCYICHNGEVSATTIDTYALNNLGSSSMKCSTASCHTGGSATPSQNGVIADKSLHINAAKNVTIANAFTVKSKAQLREASKPATWTRVGTYKAAATYDTAIINFVDWDSGAKTCVTACHNAGSVSVTATWGDTTVTCYSCHTSL
ncbi:MAG: CxxxxCH/CxxCH domain-containing protein [Thermodesulfovibrionales bacterium]|nr:CxxxxCH/CxxCH domain-containing protein [Thermodesulfovibrionales bacterium]